MTFGLELMAAKAFVLAGLMVCEQAPAPVIEIHFENNDPVATHNLDHQQLGKFQSSTQFSHSSNEVFTTGGITESNILTSFEVSFGLVTNTFSRDTCVSLSSAKITVSYTPVVHVASNYPAQSCRFNTTWLHELRHVNTNVITLNEAVETGVADMKTQGPLSPEQQEKVQQEISAKITETLTWATAEMDKTRMQRQQLVDTREEYLRLSKVCPQEQ